MAADLQAEATEVLQRLIRFNTVNPPGQEREAIEYLERYVADAGFSTELLGYEDERPNLVAKLEGDEPGPTLCYLGHVDTVLADPADWRHDPWSGEIADGCVWGRGALDMKNQVACEAVGAVNLARQGWRPGRGTLMLAFVADEETGGDVGARWLTENHPDKVRCEMLINEGGGDVFELGGRRRYGICCAEKGIFRFKLTARGRAGHASLPRTGENALLKLGPLITRLGERQPSFDLTEAPAALIAALGGDPQDPEATLRMIAAEEPELLTLIEPMLGVTFTPTMVHASEKMNVIPARAYVKVDCRVPPGLGEDVTRTRISEVLGELEAGLELEFTEQVVGNASPVDTPLSRAIGGWIRANDEGADTLPVILPGFSDSRWFREAFPECAAYGFFPQRHMPLIETSPLIHSADERIDVRDLGFATHFFHELPRELLG